MKVVVDRHVRITKGFVSKVRPPEPKNGKPTQKFFRDDRLLGFALRITSGGVKSYVLEHRIDGGTRRITLGRCDQITPAQARQKAQLMIAEHVMQRRPKWWKGVVR